MRPRSDGTQQQRADRTDQRRRSRGGPAHWVTSLTLQPLRNTLHSGGLSSPVLLHRVKKKKSCLLELAAILGVSWAILTGLNLPEEDKTGKRRQSSIIPLERFLDGCFSPCIASSSRLSHEPVSKAPLCSSASNVVPFPASSLNINNRGTLFPHQYTSILILKGLSTRETKFNVKWQDVLPTPFFSFWLAVKQLLVWGMLLLFKPDCRQRKEAVHTALTYIDNFWSWFCKIC